MVWMWSGRQMLYSLAIISFLWNLGQNESRIQQIPKIIENFEIMFKRKI